MLVMAFGKEVRGADVEKKTGEEREEQAES